MEDLLIANGLGTVLAGIERTPGSFAEVWRVASFCLVRTWQDEDLRRGALAKCLYSMVRHCSNDFEAQAVIDYPMQDLPEMNFEEAKGLVRFPYGGLVIPNLTGIDLEKLLYATLHYCSPGAFEAMVMVGRVDLTKTNILKEMILHPYENRDWLEEKCLAALELGADPWKTDAVGRNALHCAAKAKFPRLIRHLLGMGLQADGETLLNAVVWHHEGRHCEETIRLLLSAGAPLDATDYRGNTAYQLALNCRNPFASLLLLQV